MSSWVAGDDRSARIKSIWIWSPSISQDQEDVILESKLLSCQFGYQQQEHACVCAQKITQAFLGS